jgi:hypothetical protein
MTCALPVTKRRTSRTHTQSAPDNWGAIAWAFGLDPPEVTSARVPEIGCAVAGDPIPFAAMHLRARTVAVDLSQEHIDQSRRPVRALSRWPPQPANIISCATSWSYSTHRATFATSLIALRRTAWTTRRGRARIHVRP